MSKIYASPLRVYLVLGVLALAGVYCVLSLPISLFPNTAPPEIAVNIGYGSTTAEEFKKTYGDDLESLLSGLTTTSGKVETVIVDYKRAAVLFQLKFRWGDDPQRAQYDVQNLVGSMAARFPQEIRNTVSIYNNRQNTGFFAASFYSETRSLDEVYELIAPLLTPGLAAIDNIANYFIYNPLEKEMRIKLLPMPMVAVGLTPRQVEQAVIASLESYNAGSLQNDGRTIWVQIPRMARSLDDFAAIAIATPAGKVVHLGDISKIEIGPSVNKSMVLKTNGVSSIILNARPKAGGNVKKMAEDIIQVIERIMPLLPSDIKYKVLIDPSAFVRSAVTNLAREVVIGSLLAVAVLFLFIGNLRNVVTAAVEIPLSIVMAFILMKIFGLNINLISLGGLALSAGMNVDGSVVVMENIFRHFSRATSPMDFGARLKIIGEAVAEVRFAIVASTASSLVVFLPLFFTADLSHAILGDLAMAVIFSHGFSAVVALILVPTVRLQLMQWEKRASNEPVSHRSPIEPVLRWLENVYGCALDAFISRPLVKWGCGVAVLLVMFVLWLAVFPRIPQEMVGKPDTDFVFVGLRTANHALIREMDEQLNEVERQIIDHFGSSISYTFTEIHEPNNGFILVRLKNRQDMAEIRSAFERYFSNTPLTSFNFMPWNPSELPIADPDHLRIAVRSSDVGEQTRVAQQIVDVLQQERGLLAYVNTRPNVLHENQIDLQPDPNRWALINSQLHMSKSDLADIVQIATVGRQLNVMFPYQNMLVPINLSFPHREGIVMEDIAGFPVAFAGKVVPLKAIAHVRIRAADPLIHRENGQSVVILTAKRDSSHSRQGQIAQMVQRSKELVEKWHADDIKKSNGTVSSKYSISFEDPDPDFTKAISQLSFSIGVSVILLLVVLILQFGSVMEALLVLAAVPFGFVGALLALYCFNSTLSLNSILGVILLNGIAVANSILLVDFMKRLWLQGISPKEAAIAAARTRLRPILITSLTTILGMMPIAIGFGEGGRILQPLGIAVAGGLWVSMLLTIFFVPTFYASHLNSREISRKR